MGDGVVEARSEPADLWASLKPLTERNVEKAEHGTDDKDQREGEWVTDNRGCFNSNQASKHLQGSLCSLPRCAVRPL